MSGAAPPTASPVDLNKLKVPELRTELTNRGLDSKGNKAELVARLAAAMDIPATATTSAVAAEAPVAPAKPAAKAAAKPAATPTTTPTPAPAETPTPATATTTTPTTEATAGAGGEEGEAAGGEAEEEVDVTQLSEVERRKRRAERFGTPATASESDKKKMRTERFGDMSGKKKTNLDNTAAQRLGLPVKAAGESSLAPISASASSISAQMSDEKLAQRRAKFGAVEQPTPTPSAGGAKKGAKPALSAEDEEKMRKRKERFATTPEKKY